MWSRFKIMWCSQGQTSCSLRQRVWHSPPTTTVQFSPVKTSSLWGCMGYHAISSSLLWPCVRAAAYHATNPLNASYNTLSPWMSHVIGHGCRRKLRCSVWIQFSLLRHKKGPLANGLLTGWANAGYILSACFLDLCFGRSLLGFAAAHTFNRPP